MTDDQGDAEFEASLAELGDGDFVDESDGSIGGRLDSVQWALSNLGMRVDALVTSTTTYRSALSDRIDQYSEVLANATRSQAGDLEEYHRATVRALTELRRGVTASEEAIQAVAARIGQAGEAGPTTAAVDLGPVIAAQAEMRARLEEMAGSLSSSLADQVRQSQVAITEAIAGMRQAVSDAPSAPVPAPMLKEDLAQIRAIVVSIAERDLSAEVRAVHADVAAVRDALATVAGKDVGAAVRSELAPLVNSLDRISGRLGQDTVAPEVLARLDGIDKRLGALDSAGGSDEVLGRLADLEAGLGRLATGRDVADLTGNLRAQLADAVAGLGDGSTNSNAARLQTAIDRLQDAVVDVASGEVVAALWDEVRAVRVAVTEGDTGELDRLAATANAELGAARADLEHLRADLEHLRADLAEGLVVEPAPDLMEALAGLHTDLADVPAALAALSEIRTIREGISEIRDRLEDGLELADDAVIPGTGAPAEVDLGPLIDSIGSLREWMADAVGTLRREVTAAGGAPAVAALPEETELVVDLTEIETLIATIRAEVAASSGVSDQVVEAIRDELKALRRRISVKADEKVLSDAQLQFIADAVAARLAAD